MEKTENDKALKLGWHGIFIRIMVLLIHQIINQNFCFITLLLISHLIY